MKILLLGKNGQVGHELDKVLGSLGEVVSVGRPECDMSDETALRALIKTVNPEVVVNAAAYTAVDKAESENSLAYAINDRAVGILGSEAASIGALVVHYSTDYVFDGEKVGKYKENDRTNPLGVYGASKLAGEIALAKSGAKHLIFRTSWVMGVHGNNFLKTMLRLASERNEVAVVCDQYGVPTSARLIAEVTVKVLNRYTDSLKLFAKSELYHLAASGVTNWHEYATHVIESKRLSGKSFCLKTGNIKPISSEDYVTVAKRPKNSLLDTGKLQRDCELELPCWRNEVDRILSKLD